MVTGVAIAASTDPAIDDLTGPSDRDRSSFELRVPALQASVAADGSARIDLEGFESRERRAGAPDVPVRTFLVAIPFDATPALDITVIESDVVPGVRPRLVPPRPKRSLFDAEAGQFVDAPSDVPDEAAAEPDFAWLGEQGVLRDQAYVTVHVAPVRFVRSLGGVQVARRLRVTVRFVGGRAVSEFPRRAGDRLEDLYRSRFVNYAQGLYFRNRPETRLAAASAPAAPDAGPLYRIRVRANGVVRLDATRLNGTGFLTQPIATWKLTSGGVEIPMAVQDTNGNGLLDAGQSPPEWVQFYGQALDFEPKTILKNDLSTDKDIFEYRDFSDENVYFLAIESGARARMTARPGIPTGTATPPADFESVALRETDSSWFPLGAADPWYWGPVQSNPASGSSVTTRTDTVPLPGLASSSAPVRVRVRLRGMTEDLTAAPDHRSRITLKNSANSTLATNDDNNTFDGRTIYTHDFTWPGGSPGLTDPATVVTDALSVSASVGYKNQLVLDWIEIRYRRSFAASGDTLTFDYPDGDAEFEATGFASSRVEVYEITGTIPGTSLVNAVRVTGATVTPSSGTFKVRFTMANDPALVDGTPRRFVLAGDSGVSIPANPDFTSDTVSDLKSTANQADLIVIAHPSILGTTAQATLNSLLGLRASRGVTSKIAWIDDIQDEFNNGLSGPDAIQNLLAWVMSTTPGQGWAAPKPAYVMLIGDGSYDMKDKFAKTNFLPTEILFQDDPQFGYYASDTLLAAVVGTDDIPDLVVGRLPARSDAEANTILTKILNYEQSAPAGNWRRHAILVSDRGKNYDPGEATDSFEATNDLAIAKMKIPPHTRRRMRYWSDPQYCGGTQAGCTPLKTEQLRADIKAAINGTDGISDGAAIMQFAGHGNFNVWSDDAFFAQNWNALFDVDQLVNGGKLPWLLAQNCLTGGFQSTIDVTIGESFVRRSGGGAIAVLAPTGLSTTYVGADVTNTIWGDVFGPHKQRDIAVPVLDAVTGVCITGDVLPCQSYALLGDPALHLVIPEVAPPTAVTATGGNARVDLAWTASTTGGAKYDVYRSTSTPSGPYTKQNASPITGTAYADTTAVNAKTYYYYVLALDADGFESRWSHFNSDCGAGDADCLTATPLNPNPPAPPTGLVVTDPESGAKLNLSWNANSETDLKSYTVNYGTSPGVYTSTANAGSLTSYALTSLVNGQRYYIAITATNTSGKISIYSQEQFGTPTFVRGVRSPDFISGLKIDKSGTNAVLTWPAVTTDIYGKPATISSYEVYRGTTPTFVPGPGNKIAQPTSATFTDPGALSFANPNYYYLVRAVDASGNVGGLGNQLPNGIDTLTLSKTPDGQGGFTLGFTWPAVTTDFDGLPLAIDHYEVYGTDHPFTRADVKSGLVALLASPTTATWSVTAPAASQYYSVLAVDARGNKSSF